jgi:hypothetical protein
VSPARRHLWIACYIGSIQIFSDTGQPFALAASAAVPGTERRKKARHS